MRTETSEIPLLDDIRSLNRGFLSLLTSYRCSAASRLLGLDEAVFEQLRSLSPQQLDAIAQTPGLLVQFSSEPSVLKIADAGPRSEINRRWVAAAQLYTICLLTWLKQLDSRVRDSYPIGQACFGAIPIVDFCAIDREADTATSRLQARFADHPFFWSHLVRGATLNDPELLTLAQLSIIPMSLVPQDRGHL